MFTNRVHNFSWLTCALLLASLCNSSQAQERAGGKWSAMGFADFGAAASPSMRGSASDFANQIAASYTNATYPFAGQTFVNIPAGLQIAYGLPASNAGVFLAYHWTVFTADNIQSSNPNVTKEELDITSLTAGAEYSLLHRGAPWNAFIRAGIAMNWVSGYFEYGLTKTNIPSEIRFGFESEIGLRWNIPGTPIGIELSGAYLNANVINKSYTPPSAQPTALLGQRALNDAADLSNGQNHSRVIDCVSARCGLRYWF